jgi:hypothetical protein
MSDVFILVKNDDYTGEDEYTHTYSKVRRDKLIKEGWKYIYEVHGWNVGATNKVK